MMKKIYLLSAVITAVFTLHSCKKNNGNKTNTYIATDPVVIKNESELKAKGFLLTTERSRLVNGVSTSTYSVDFYNFEKKSTDKNVIDFNNRMPVAMFQYGSKIYAAISAGVERKAGGNQNQGYEYTNPGYLLVIDAKNFQILKKINMTNPSAIAAYNGKVMVADIGYLSSDDKNYINANAENKKGFVQLIDTVAFQPIEKIKVGLQPKALVLKAQKLYVANSDTYSIYDKLSISVINFSTPTPVITETPFQIQGLIDMKLEGANDKIWVSSSGSFNSPRTFPALNKIDLGTLTIEKTLDIFVRGSAFGFSDAHMIFYNDSNYKIEAFDLKSGTSAGFTPSVPVYGTLYHLFSDTKTGDYNMVATSNNTTTVYFFDKAEKFKYSFQTSISGEAFMGVYVY